MEDKLAADLWRERSQLDELRSILDPGDTRGIKNKYIDFVHRSALARECGIAREDTILDFGCGRGRMTAWLTSQGRRVWGLDLVWEMLRVGSQKQNPANVCFAVGQGETLPWSVHTFDKILTIYVLQHILNPDLMAAVLMEFSRVLKPGGRLILLEQVHLREPRVVENYIRQRVPNEYQTALARAGLAVVQAQPLRAHSILTHVIATGIIPERLFAILARLDARLAGSTRFSFPYMDYLIIAEKT